MQYQGGKTRPGKAIATILARGLAAGTGNYIEPFMGACGVARHVAPHALSMTLSDASEDLVLMWQAVRGGWVPPTEMSEERYLMLRGMYPCPERGFAGYGCSFGGKWFSGYARNAKHGYAAAASRGLVRKHTDLSRCPRVSIYNYGYERAEPRVGDVVYCDPPYAGTTGYARTGKFDTDRFWSTMQAWDDAHAFVFVSEFAAPEGWVRVWGKARDKCMRGGAATENKVDGLYCTPTTAQILGLDGGTE